MNITAHKQTLIALIPRGWIALAFGLAFSINIFSLAFNTAFRVHVGAFVSSVFLFAIISGYMVREVMSKPVSFCLPAQQRLLGPVVVVLGVVFCGLFIGLSLQLIQFNEDHADYPIALLRDAFLPLWCWSLAFYLVSVTITMRSLLLMILLYMLFPLSAFVTYLVEIWQPQNYPLIAVAGVIVSVAFSLWFSRRRALARVLCGDSLPKQIDRIRNSRWLTVAADKINVPARSGRGGTDTGQNMLRESSYLAINGAIGKLLISLLVSVYLLATLILSFKDIRNVESFYLFLIPLAPLCFPVFGKGVSFSPWLPVSRSQQFVRTLVHGVLHYVLAVATVLLIYLVLSMLKSFFPDANWFLYVKGALDMPFRAVFLLTLFAPVAALFHIAIRPPLAALVCAAATGVLAFNVLDGMVNSFVSIDLTTVLLISGLCWLPLVAANYIYAFKRDLVAT